MEKFIYISSVVVLIALGTYILVLKNDIADYRESVVSLSTQVEELQTSSSIMAETIAKQNEEIKSLGKSAEIYRKGYKNLKSSLEKRTRELKLPEGTKDCQEILKAIDKSFLDFGITD